MRCEVAVISLTYLVWKKKEEESIFTAEDMGAGEGFEIDRGALPGGRWQREAEAPSAAAARGRGGGGRPWGPGE